FSRDWSSDVCSSDLQLTTLAAIDSGVYATGHTGRIRVDDEQADALLVTHIASGTRGDNDLARGVAADYHGLATVQGPVAAGLLGHGLHVEQVVVAARLIQRDGGLQLTAGDSAQQFFLLLLAAQLANQAAGQYHGFHVGFQADAAAQLLHDQHGFHAAAAKTAQLFGEGDSGQTQLAQLLPELGAETGVAGAELEALFKGVNVANQTGRGVLEHLLLFGQFEVHDRRSLEFENHFRDDVLLDLVGSAEDRQFAHVEVGRGWGSGIVVDEEFAVVVQLQLFRQEGQGIWPQRLAHQMRDGLADLGALSLEDRAFRTRYTAFGGSGDDAQGTHFSRHQRHFHFSDLRTEQGVFKQRLAALFLFGGNLLQVAQGRLGGADAGQAGTLVGQQVLGAGPALVLFTDQVFHRYAYVIEEHFVDFMVAVQSDDRAHGDTWGRHVDQQEGDAALLLGFRVGTHQTEDHVGVLAQSGPGLLTVDDVVVAIAHGAGLQRGEVGTGAWLGVALAPPVLTGQDAWQVLLLLCFGTELDDHRSDHGDAEGNGARRAGGRGFFIKDVFLYRAPVGAAVLDRP